MPVVGSGPAFLDLVVMVGHDAADGRAGEGVMTGEVTGDATDKRAPDAAFGIGGACGHNEKGGGGKSDKAAHFNS